MIPSSLLHQRAKCNLSTLSMKQLRFTSNPSRETRCLPLRCLLVLAVPPLHVNVHVACGRGGNQRKPHTPIGPQPSGTRTNENVSRNEG